MTAVWKLEGSQARLAQPNLSAAVDLLRPDLGLTGAVYRGQKVPLVALLAVDLPEVSEQPQSLSDHWVRGNDLVAVYEPTALRPTRVEVYWRWHELPPALDPSGVCAAVELQVSVQTHLLDSHPEVSCSTVAAAPACARLTADPYGQWQTVSASAPADYTPPADRGGTLWQWPTPGVAYAELVFPADFRVDALSPQPGGGWRLRHRLFPEFLEKGVILRSRIRGLFCSAVEGEATARAACEHFAASPLPLTT